MASSLWTADEDYILQIKQVCFLAQLPSYPDVCGDVRDVLQRSGRYVQWGWLLVPAR